MPVSSASQTFRANLRLVMEERNLTITELAETCNLVRQEMSRILAGKVGVTLDRAERISKALGIPLVELLAEEFQKVA